MAKRIRKPKTYEKKLDFLMDTLEWLKRNTENEDGEFNNAFIQIEKWSLHPNGTVGE